MKAPAFQATLGEELKVSDARCSIAGLETIESQDRRVHAHSQVLKQAHFAVERQVVLPEVGAEVEEVALRIIELIGADGIER